MSDAASPNGRSTSAAARATKPSFWVLRNVVVAALSASPAVLALGAAADVSSWPVGTPLVDLAVEGVLSGMFLWILFLPAVVSAAAVHSSVVVGLSLVLAGMWLRLAGTVPLTLFALLGGTFPTATPPDFAYGFAILACFAAYGWFSAVPPGGVGARARWEATLVYGATALSLATPVVITLLLIAAGAANALAR